LLVIATAFAVPAPAVNVSRFPLIAARPAGGWTSQMLSVILAGTCRKPWPGRL
jgi:hypothetical protein